MSTLQGEVLAEVFRAGIVESTHSGHLVLINSDGSIRRNGPKWTSTFTEATCDCLCQPLRKF